MSDLEEESDRQEDENLDDISEHVMQAFRRAKSHRDNIGVTQALIDCLARVRGKYQGEDLCKFEGISTYRGLTGMLVRSAHGWLRDAYFSAQDQPWVIQPTPVPDLPESIQAELAVTIEKNLQMSLMDQQTAIQKDDKRKLINELRNTASDMAYEYALERTKAMTKLMTDQLLEAGWRDVFSEVLLDVCVFPFAVLKGPVVRNKQVPVWEKDKYKFKSVQKYYFERVNPMNFYPSPDSSNTQDGEFVIEVMPMSRARLNEAKKLKNFSKEAINLVISENGTHYHREPTLRVDDNSLVDLDGVKRSGSGTSDMYDVYEFNGRISGELLIEYADKEDMLMDAMDDFGTEVETEWGSIDPYDDYEATIWVCNGVTIMARLNPPNPVPMRNYYTTSCFKIPGSIYGECIPLVVADLQDEINSAARARVYNTGMSSGPIVEADVSRFPDGETPEQILPWMVYPVTSNGMQGNNNAPAMRFNVIPDVSANLTAVMEESWEKAHRISGIPPYMYGDNQGSAQTLGAFSLQYAGATKGIKTIISNIDEDMIEKAMQTLYYWNMFYSDDEGIKADARVNVRGASGLIAQEQRQARPLELLQALGPILAQMQPETAIALANETLTESGYDPAKLGLAKGNASREAANRQIGVGGPSPDGRSGSAQAQLAQQQLPIPQG